MNYRNERHTTGSASLQYIEWKSFVLSYFVPDCIINDPLTLDIQDWLWCRSVPLVWNSCRKSLLPILPLPPFSSHHPPGLQRSSCRQNLTSHAQFRTLRLKQVTFEEPVQIVEKCYRCLWFYDCITQACRVYIGVTSHWRQAFVMRCLKNSWFLLPTIFDPLSQPGIVNGEND